MNSAQNSTNGSRDGAGWTAVTSIPLSEEGTAPDGQSIGSLVRDATTHLSTLVRSEVELAKTELAGEMKKAVKGSVYFILALTVLAFSMFFLFFTLAEGLAQLGLWRWAAFGIVFLLMLVVAGLMAFLGYLRVRKIRAPKRTIESLKETSQLAKRHKEEEPTHSA
ncbi:Putative Holin-X, holin superfamily III [Saccharopolyspora antimicrobica]|uniref:Putative Holin-X, holin superfamily III n=1 Tax=Saccharopolyspora antimicrobica TaxID=455193 RepID=A0A1I5FZ87_9PSEU|nr:phage holin family protein [Saccharopolyspora antimicrobica]RKT84012.1 putative superfamily III holin-X [Saccharopolyspora antimicrobica]SFO28939.1 Putative Holin-X, holin superfamily III [Saccharopolyspora antimicrobica]